MKHLYSYSSDESQMEDVMASIEEKAKEVLDRVRASHPVGFAAICAGHVSGAVHALETGDYGWRGIITPPVTRRQRLEDALAWAKSAHVDVEDIELALEAGEIE